MKDFKFYCGIDYSMTSPGVCIIPAAGGEFRYMGIGSKTIEGSYKFPGHRLDVFLNEKDWKTKMERYTKLSKIAHDWIISVTGNNDTLVLFEGYSFGSSRSKTFDIAEATQTMKLRIANTPNFVLIDDSVPPKSLKSFATGNGNAGKDMMYDAYQAFTGIDWIEEHFPKKKKEASPISDFIDAYWLASYALEKQKELIE